MAADSQQMEKLIIESVINELAKRGVLDSPGEDISKTGSSEQKVQSSEQPVAQPEIEQPDHEFVTIPDLSEVWVPEPENPEAVEAMKRSTPARIGLYRSGPRQKTNSLLRFLADHAVALDAVFMDVSQELLESVDLFSVQSGARDKEEFLKNPETGNILSTEAVETLSEKCEKGVQVQIIVCDGLSSTAIETNITNIIPPVIQGLQAAGIKIGTPFFIKNGRVRVMDHVGDILNPEVVLEFIGERPGLGTVESMSAYLCYKPNKNTVEAERTMISNIHKGGTPPAEAGAQIVQLIKNILKYKASGINLNEKMK